ncbi:MAG: galactose-1-epimerase, partial [Alphaproteobacteria bacterium]|nr:galactose-1-epimerase [Alphaproteobacteria bacterium]
MPHDQIPQHFGWLPNGEEVKSLSIKNSDMMLEVLTYGAIIRRWAIRLQDGTYRDITLGLNSLEDYLKHSPYFGAVAGRYANRIANAKAPIGDDVFS